MYKIFFKHIIDFFIALIGLLILSPVFLIVFIALFFANRGKPFFLQARPGRNEKIFYIIKFKTMNDKKNKTGILLADEERMTNIGNFIRKTSLDELPQLLNVLKGDMSIVGPRPLLVTYLPLYNAKQKRRHEVRPGITGWTQVNGRNSISWERKFAYDVWYVDHLCFSLDLKIIIKTIKKVFIREGINAEGEATMNPFLGNK